MFAKTKPVVRIYRVEQDLAINWDKLLTTDKIKVDTEKPWAQKSNYFLGLPSGEITDGVSHVDVCAEELDEPAERYGAKLEPGFYVTVGFEKSSEVFAGQIESMLVDRGAAIALAIDP